jgi:hypothetical protein
MAEDDKRHKIGIRSELREGLSRIFGFRSCPQAIVPAENLEISERIGSSFPHNSRRRLFFSRHSSQL